VAKRYAQQNRSQTLEPPIRATMKLEQKPRRKQPEHSGSNRYPAALALIAKWKKDDSDYDLKTVEKLDQTQSENPVSFRTFQ
jgi:hypothetical protein